MHYYPDGEEGRSRNLQVMVHHTFNNNNEFTIDYSSENKVDSDT
ncbi:MAG: hypothetical protein R2764_17990 [Bacteroidales bacterium]